MSLQGPQIRNEEKNAILKGPIFSHKATIDLKLKLRLTNQLQILKAEWRVQIQAQGWQPCAILVILCFCTKQ